jgi:acetoacetate decarboxylase
MINDGFHFAENNNYFMPVSLMTPGKDEANALVGAHYGDNRRYSISYLTDYDGLAALLPPGFKPIKPAKITVTYAMCRDVEYMAGGGYNLLDVDAHVVFEGEKDHAEGCYGLVIWMDKFYPILLGRELLGAAKLMAEIPDIRTIGEKKTFFAAEDGSRLVEGELWDFKERTAGEIKRMELEGEGKSWLGYKYFPAVDLKGADVAYATFLPTSNVVKSAWSAQGRLEFHDLPWKDAPLSSNVASTLKKLPIKEYAGASVQFDSCIYLPNRKLL